MSNLLPNGWTEITLHDVGTWCSGGTPSRQKAEYFGNGIPWIKSGDLPDGPVQFTGEEITELGLQNSSAKLLPIGTISMALYGATIGKLGVMTVSASTNQACANVIPNIHLVDTDFLFYYLLSERQKFIEKGQGGAQPNISQEIVRNHPFRLAPLAEQRRIVSKLEKLLAKVDVSQNHLIKISILIKQFRQSVLAAACSGRLTADWRKNDLIRNELPVGWWEATLSEIGEIVTGNTPSRSSLDNFGDSIPWVKPPDLNAILPITKTEEFLSKKGAALARLLPPGAVLVSCIGNLGKVGFAGTILATNQQINSIIFNKDKVLPRYGYFFCQTLKPWMEENSSATTLSILNKGRFSEAPIVVPPILEQEEIVQRVERLFVLADKLEIRHQKAKQQVDMLTQSILAKAFSGGLVSQDPNDEPAEKLLKRIKNI